MTPPSQGGGTGSNPVGAANRLLLCAGPSYLATVVGGAFLSPAGGGVFAPVGGGVFAPVDGGAFFSPAGGGVFAPVGGGAFLSPFVGGVFVPVVGGAFLSPAGDVGDFLGVVVDVSDAAFTLFGAIPARPSDNATMAVIFFISILECGVFYNETISNSQKIKRLIGGQ